MSLYNLIRTFLDDLLTSEVMDAGSVVTSQHEGPCFEPGLQVLSPCQGGFLRELWFPLQSNHMQVRWIRYS